METQLNKDETIEITISSHDKRVFQKAQKLSGDKSLNSFIVRAAKTQAEEIIAKNNLIIASDRDREIFFDAVFRDSKPNPNLIETANRYKFQQIQ
jgi:uncharacterized protein (DUF1778 family)